MKHSRPDYARIQDPAGLIPDDEPVFLIRGRDRAAPYAVRAYAHFAEQAGASGEFCDQARQAAKMIEDWQEANPLRVKVPDAPRPK